LNVTIKQMIETSLIDWEGKIVSTLYVPSCNFRCPYCYNCDLILYPENFPNIAQSEIDSFLLERKDFIDGICMSGGEPTLYPDLPTYFKKIRDKGHQDNSKKGETDNPDPGGRFRSGNQLPAQQG